MSDMAMPVQKNMHIGRENPSSDGALGGTEELPCGASSCLLVAEAASLAADNRVRIMMAILPATYSQLSFACCKLAPPFAFSMF